MLRKALGETPLDHQYILTVPGRGYRFAENVRLVPDQQLSIVAANHSRVQVQIAESKPWAGIAVAAIILVIVAAGISRFFLRGKVLTERDTIVLADFTNSTGDPVFDETLRLGLTVQLEQSPFLSLIPEERIHRTLRLMGKSADASLTPPLAREICERTGSAAVLEGSIATLGNQYVLGLRARSCHTGDILDDEQTSAARKEDVLSALSQIATRFRKRVGESLTTVSQHDVPLAEATTSSLEALEAYTEGLRAHFSAGAIAALPFFKRAVEIDPEFAMAHAYLGRVYANLDESDLAAESISTAWQLRNRVTDRERFAITTRYDALVTGNLEKTRETCEAWIQTCPRDPQPHIGLSVYYNATGQYGKAASESEKAIEVDPDFSIAYSGLAADYVYLDRLEEAGDILGRAAGRGLEIDEFIMLDYDIAFLRSDQAGMERAVARARERSGGDNWISNHEAFALAYSGKLQQARNLTTQAVNEAEQAGQRERAALWEAGSSVRESLFGNAPEAQSRAAAALRLSKDREAEYGAGLALAISRNSKEAREIADDLEKRFPQDSCVRSSYLPTLRGLLALDSRDASKAIELLQAAVPDELGTPRSSIHALFGALYPIYVRGEAYLAEGKGAEAAAEFQKIVNHPGIAVSDPVGVVAHLQLGRAYALVGNTAKAKSVYQGFLKLWKDADPGIPILKQAQAEFSKLP